MNKLKTQGYLLLETLAALVLLSIIIITIFPTINFMLQRSRRSTTEAQASLVVQAGMEAAYHIFLSNWNAYPNDVGYSLIPDLSEPGSPKWTLTALAADETQLIQTKFNRRIDISAVERDPKTGEAGSGELDLNSRKVTTTVSWEEGGLSKSLKADLLLVNLNP